MSSYIIVLHSMTESCDRIASEVSELEMSGLFFAVTAKYCNCIVLYGLMEESLGEGIS